MASISSDGETMTTLLRKGLLHDVVEAVVQVGIDRLRRHEHQGQILGLARDQIFVGDAADVPAEILAQPRRGLLALVVALGVTERGDRFERKFGVDHQRAPVRQKYGAVGPALVGQRELEFVAALRQPVLDDQLHAPLAEGAALLLVGEHALQRGDLRCQIGDVPLRAVDDHEPLVELLQALDGVLPGRGHRLVEVVRHRIEPLVDRAVQLGLAAGEQVAHALDAHRGLRLQPRKLDQLLVGGFRIVPAQGPHGDHDQGGQQREPGEHDHDRGGEGERGCPSCHTHPTSIRAHMNKK